MDRTALPKLMFLNRQIKPVALGVALAMLVLSVFNILGQGRLGDTTLAWFVPVMALASFTLLCGGWWFRSRRLAKWGLLIATFVYIVRSVFLMFILGINDIGPWLSAASTVIVAGSYLLECSTEEEDWS